MSDLFIRMNARLAHAPPTITETARLLCLFVLLGVAVSAATLPHLSADELGWVFAHLE